MKNKMFKKMILLGAGIISLVSVSCGSVPEEEPAKEIPVTSIDFKTELSSVYVGFETYITKLKVLPENATNKDVTWSVSDPSIAIINDNGSVSALKAGTTKLIATAQDGSNVKKEMDFIVKPLEKPSSWNLSTSYCFHVDETFTPDLVIYPDSQYVDRSATFEVIEGTDVLKIVDGKIGAYKEGRGVVLAKSNSNPDLVGNITCIADRDNFTKFKFKETSVGGEANFLSEKFDRSSVLSFKGPVKKDNWPIVIIELDKIYSTKQFVAEIDARLVSGTDWYSIRLAKDGLIYPASEYGCEPCGGGPSKDKWNTNTFDFRHLNLNFNQIVLCINADSLYQKGCTDPVAEILFDNLTFAEFADVPSAISVIEPEVLLPLGQTSDIKVEFTPKFVKNTELIYKVKEGYENIVSVENGKLLGLAKGTGYVEIASAANPEAKAEAKVIVSDSMLISLPILFAENNIAVTNKVNYEGRDVTTVFTVKSSPGEAWYGVCYKLPEKVMSNTLRITLDAKLVSGYNWFSVATYSTSIGKRFGEIGQNPTKEEWTTYTFETEEAVLVDSIMITINTLSYESSEFTELLFANLGIFTK